MHPGVIAQVLLAARARFDSMLRTAAARASANLGSGARILSGGNIYNIRKTRDAIQVGHHSLIAGDLLTFAHGGQINVGAWCYIGAGSRVDPFLP